MPRIHVLHVADKLSFSGRGIHGVTRLFGWWMPQFDKKRFRVTVCSLRARDEAGDYLERNGVEVFYLGKRKLDPFALLSLIKLIKEQQVSILHLHGYAAWTLGRIAGVILRIPSVLHEHIADAKVPLYVRIADGLLSGTGAMAIAVSDAVADFMVARRGVPEDRVEVILNGVPLGEFLGKGWRRNPQYKRLRQELKIPSDHLVVGAVGRLHPNKGFSYLLQAARQIVSKLPGVTFLIVGDGNEMGRLKKLTQDLDLDRNVRFAGHRDDIGSMYALMDVFVIPSLSEGGPITLMEAMASGCPVVATERIGLKRLVEIGHSGYLVPARDPEALAKFIVLLLENERHRDHMSESARESASGFGVNHTVNALEMRYERLLST